MKRGAYFFVLDAFIAGIIIISTIAVLFGAFEIQDDPRQSYSLAENFMTFFEEQEMGSYSGDARSVLEHPAADSQATVLEQIVLFYEAQKAGDATAGSQNAVLINDFATFAPANSGFAFTLIDPDPTPLRILLFEHNTDFIAQADARLGVVSQRIVISKESGTPYTVEVTLWR